MAKGQNRRQEKCPALQNCHEPIQATIIFRTKAVGLIAAGVMLNSVITAMYPDAPAWPTDEYRNATMPMQAVMKIILSGVMVFPLLSNVMICG